MEATQYSGSHGNEKILSASSLLDDDLQVFLKIKNGMKPDMNTISQSTAGTLMHMGIDNVFKDVDNTHVAVRRKVKLKNNWILSGETDVEIYDKDTNTLHIIDNKHTKEATYDRIRKEPSREVYSMQLKAYEWLYKKTFPNSTANVKVYLAMYIKDGNKFIYPEIPDFRFIELTNFLISDEEFEQLINDKIDRLEEYIKENKTPDECKTLLWNRSKDGKARKQRCISYCDVSYACPYYKDTGHTDKHSKSIANLLAGKL